MAATKSKSTGRDSPVSTGACTEWRRRQRVCPRGRVESIGRVGHSSRHHLGHQCRCRHCRALCRRYSPDEILDLFSGLSFNDLAEITLPRAGFFKIDRFKAFLAEIVAGKEYRGTLYPRRRDRHRPRPRHLRGVAFGLDSRAGHRLVQYPHHLPARAHRRYPLCRRGSAAQSARLSHTQRVRYGHRHQREPAGQQALQAVDCRHCRSLHTASCPRAM